MEFGSPIVGTEDLIRSAIKSPNYEPGIAGWIIRQDGTAEFQDIIARGNIEADRLHVPFVNQENDTYAIDVGQANPDQPGVLFEFVGTDVPSWRDGSIKVEAFDSATGWGETTWEPLQPNGFLLGSPPNIRIQSHRANGTPGRVDISSSLALTGVGEPTLQVSSIFKIIMERLRPITATLASNTGRTLTSTTFTTALGADTLSVTIPAAGSDTIIVSLWAQADITAGAGFICFEVRATNGAGTQLQAPVDGTGINMVNLAGSRISYFFQTPVTDVNFSDTELFVRVMARTTTGGTFTIQRARLTAQVSP